MILSGKLENCNSLGLTFKLTPAANSRQCIFLAGLAKSRFVVVLGIAGHSFHARSLYDCAYILPTKTIPQTQPEENSMTKEQEKDLFTEWERYKPTEQRLMIDEYLCVSEGNGSKERFLSFLRDKMEIEGYWEKVGLA